MFIAASFHVQLVIAWHQRSSFRRYVSAPGTCHSHPSTRSASAGPCSVHSKILIVTWKKRSVLMSLPFISISKRCKKDEFPIDFFAIQHHITTAIKQVRFPPPIHIPARACAVPAFRTLSPGIRFLLRQKSSLIPVLASRYFYRAPASVFSVPVSFQLSPVPAC